MHYLYVVIIFFTRALYNPAFSTYALKSWFLVYISAFFVCSVLNSVLLLDFIAFV